MYAIVIEIGVHGAICAAGCNRHYCMRAICVFRVALYTITCCLHPVGGVCEWCG